MAVLKPLNVGLIITGGIYLLGVITNFLPQSNPLLGGNPSALIIQEEGLPHDFQVSHLAALVWMHSSGFMTMIAFTLIAVGALCREAGLLRALSVTFILTIFIGLALDVLFPAVPGKTVDSFVVLMSSLIVFPLVSGILCHRNSEGVAQGKGPLNKFFIMQGCIWLLLEIDDWQYSPIFGGNPEKLVGQWAGAGYKLTRFDEHALMTSDFFGSQVTIFLFLMGALTANKLLLRTWGMLLIVFEMYCLYTVYVWGFSEAMSYHMPETYIIGNTLTWFPLCIGIGVSFFVGPSLTEATTPLLVNTMTKQDNSSA